MTARRRIATFGTVALTLLTACDGEAPRVIDGPPPMRDQMLAAGAKVYAAHCLACHQADGSGVPHLYPAMFESPSVADRDPTRLIRAVVHGVGAPNDKTLPRTGEYGAAMAAFGHLRDDELAALVTYVRREWGGAAPVSARDIAAAR